MQAASVPTPDHPWDRQVMWMSSQPLKKVGKGVGSDIQKQSSVLLFPLRLAYRRLQQEYYSI